MTIKTIETTNTGDGYVGEFENEITGTYLSLWLTAKIEEDAAKLRCEHFLGEYNRLRLLELKNMKYDKYLKTLHWKTRRKEALKAANNKCQLCGSGGELHVHHKNYDRRGEELAEDLIVLCKECHAKHHDKE